MTPPRLIPVLPFIAALLLLPPARVSANTPVDFDTVAGWPGTYAGFSWTNWTLGNGTGAGGTDGIYSSNVAVPSVIQINSGVFTAVSIDLSFFGGPGSVVVEGYDGVGLVATQTINHAGGWTTVPFNGDFTALVRIEVVPQGGSLYDYDNFVYSNNAPPTIGGTVVGQAVNDTATVAPFSTVTIGDADGDNVTLTVTLDSNAKGVFTVASLTASGFTDSGGGVYDLASGSAAAAQTAIRQLVYNPADNRVAPGATETTTFAIAADDGIATTTDNTTTVVSTSVNDAPLLVAGGTAAYTEGGAAAVIDAGLTISDPDPADLASATVSITANFTTGDTLAADTTGTNITPSYNGTTGVLSLTGADTVVNYEAVLAAVAFSSSSDDPTAAAASRTITFLASDGVADDSDTATVNITAVNDAPTVTSGGTLNYAENAVAAAIDAGVVVDDVDDVNIESGTVSISVGFDTGDVLTADVSGTAIAAGYIATTGVLTLTGADTVGNYEAVFRSVAFNSTADVPTTPKTVAFAVDDGDAAGSDTATINVAAVNDPPTVTAGGTLNYTENAVAAVIDAGVVVDDVDDVNIESGSVSISVGFDTGDVLTADVSGTAIAAGYNATIGVLTLTGTDTVGNYEMVLRSVTFESTADDPTTPKTVTFAVDDGDDPGSDTAAVNVTAVNDAPTLVAGGTLNYTEEDGAAVIDAAVSVSDADDTNFESAEVSITVGFDTGDELAADVTGTSIAAAYNATTGVLTLTGTDSVANYESVLRSVTFDTTHDDPTATKTITYTVDDGDAQASDTATVDMTGVNDPPSIVSAGNLNYSENDPPAVVDGAITVSDPDDSQLESGSAAVVPAILRAGCNGFDPGDVLTADTGGTNIVAAYNAATGVMTFTGADSVANYQAVFRSVTFASSSDTPCPMKAVKFTANDGDDEDFEYVYLTVTPINDAPSLTSGATSVYSAGGAPAVVDAALRVSDVDDTQLTGAEAAVTGSFVGGDILSAKTAGTAITADYDADTGVLELSGADTLANYQAVLRTVTFSTVTTLRQPARVVTFTVDDGQDTASDEANISILLAPTPTPDPAPSPSPSPEPEPSPSPSPQPSPEPSPEPEPEPDPGTTPDPDDDPSGGETPRLRVQVASSSRSATVGEVMNFTISVENVGDAGADDVRVTIPIPPNTEFVDALVLTGDSAQGVPSETMVGDGEVTVVVGDVPPGARVEIGLVLRAIAEGPVSVGVQVRSGEDSAHLVLEDDGPTEVDVSDIDPEAVLNRSNCGMCGALGYIPLFLVFCGLVRMALISVRGGGRRG